MAVELKNRDVDFPIGNTTLRVKTPFRATYQVDGDAIKIRFQEPKPQVQWLIFHRVIEGVDVLPSELIIRIPDFPDKRVPF